MRGAFVAIEAEQDVARHADVDVSRDHVALSRTHRQAGEGKQQWSK
jgi:hypothetical protein